MIHKRDVFIVLFHLYVNPMIHSMYYVLFLTIIAGVFGSEQLNFIISGYICEIHGFIN